MSYTDILGRELHDGDVCVGKGTGRNVRGMDDDFNDHECLEVMQYRVEEKIREHYLDESKYYKDLADRFMEEA
ncbi:hypothetical protein AALB39_03910 [Lachnospiraceae bacterium 54-53]